jgi:hypothetical protein
VSITSPTPVWQDFVSLADAKAYLQYPDEKTDQDAVLGELLGSACWWIQDFLGRPIAPTQFFRRYDGWTGWNGAIIELPYYPVLEVVRLAEYWGLSGPHVLQEQTPDFQYGVGQTAQTGGSNVYQLDPIGGKVTRTFPGLVQRPFFPGSRNVEVTWVAGFNPVPRPVRLAALELFSWWYRNTQEDPRMAARVGPYGGAEGTGQGGLWPAVPNRVQQLLAPYVQVGVG